MSWRFPFMKNFETAIPTGSVDDSIKKMREIMEWSDEKAKEYDENCTHSYDLTIDENGFVNKCIYCGHEGRAR